MREKSERRSAREPVEGDPVSEVARRLRAGDLSVEQAVELLIDDAVRRQVGSAVADGDALAAELKAVLRRESESDPYLAGKVKRLSRRR